jgi:hypothetical protein
MKSAAPTKMPPTSEFSTNNLRRIPTMRRNTARANSAYLRDRKELPTPPPHPTKKIRVPLTEREAARLDPRQLDLFFSPAASTGVR